MKDWTGNASGVWKTVGASNHAAGERERDDYYATDPSAVDKLLAVERPHPLIWECAAGGGHLARRLKECGFEVYASDILDRGYPLDVHLDFLTANWFDIPRGGSDLFDILTNPPYKYAKEFVLKALDLLPAGGRCYMFLKLTFLEGRARRRLLFDRTPPRTLYVFSDRMFCAKNGAFDAMREMGGGAVAYAWYVWEQGYRGDTVIKWI